MMRSRTFWSAVRIFLLKFHPHFKTVAFIGIWWMVAFYSYSQTTLLPTASPTSNWADFQTFSSLPIDRQVLQKALAGDFFLMGQLMAEWDIEAQLLQKKGFIGIERLPSEHFLRAQFLSRSLKKQPKKERLLPQSYAAATILLALASPEQIVALPQGMRTQERLFPKALTDSIPLDVNRYNSERLFLTKPDTAFVSAHYSHPATIEALRNQGIATTMLKSLDRMEAIQEAIAEIGQAANRSLEAEILNTFIDAALLAINNQLPESLPKTLYVNHYTELTTPSAQTFTHEQLQWLGIESKCFNGLKPGMRIDQELLSTLKPDCLIISTADPASLQAKIARQAVYRAIKKIYFLDDLVQQAASQYAVLAYYDIVEALLTHIDV